MLVGTTIILDLAAGDSQVWEPPWYPVQGSRPIEDQGSPEAHDQWAKGRNKAQTAVPRAGETRQVVFQGHHRILARGFGGSGSAIAAFRHSRLGFQKGVARNLRDTVAGEGPPGMSLKDIGATCNPHVEGIRKGPAKVVARGFPE